MSLMKRPIGLSRLDDSYSKDQSFSRGGSSSLNTSLVRGGKSNQDFSKTFNAFKQNVRQQVTSSIQGYGNQGVPIGMSQSPMSGSYNNFFFSANNTSSSQQNLFAQKKSRLSSPYNFKTAITPVDSGTFKKKISDSVASRPSPGRQRNEGSGLMINKGLGGGQDIWGLRTSNPAPFKLAGRSSSPPRSNVSSLTNLNNPSRSSKLGLDLNINGVNRLRSSPLRDSRILNDASNSSRIGLGMNASARVPSGGNVLSLQDELAKKSFIPTVEVGRSSKVSVGISTSASRKKEQPFKFGIDIGPKTTTGSVTKSLEKKFSSMFNQKEEQRKPSKIITKLAREIEKIQNDSHPRRTYSAASRNSNQGGSPSRFAPNSNQEERTNRSRKEEQRFDFNRTGAGARSSFASALSIPKLQELQDMFADLPERDFDELPTNYLEECVKLSSVIMHRVKTSTYYNAKPRVV